MLTFSTFLFLISFTFILANPATSIEDPLVRLKRSTAHIHGLVFNQLRLPQIDHHHQFSNRNKRQIQFGSNDDNDNDSTLCLFACAQQLRQVTTRFPQFNQVETTSPNKVFKPSLTVTQFTQICTAMREPIQCYDRCTNLDAQTRKIIKSSTDLLRYMCMDRYQDFVKNIPCMQKIGPARVDQCAPQCRQYESAVNKTIQLGQRPYLRNIYSIEEMREMVSGTCQYVKCFLDCGLPLTRTVCGETAAELTKTVIQKTFAVVASEDPSGGANLPLSCRQLAQPETTTGGNDNELRQISDDNDYGISEVDDSDEI